MINTTKRMTVVIMLALVLWGVYLAIGATGVFVQSTMTDGRKSLIVLVCMGLFLGLWAIVIRRQQSQAKSGSASSEAPAAGEPRSSWSRSGIATVVCAVLGAALWCLAIATWTTIGLGATTMIGWLAAFCMLASATSGMIALSDRQGRRGKWLGFVGLLCFASSLIGFVARMTP
jgi:hypothetical protein